MLISTDSHRDSQPSREGRRILAVRTDSDGDVLLAGPALRTLGHCAQRLDLLVAPTGEQAARLLPGIDEILVAEVPWSGDPAPRLTAGDLDDLVARVWDGGYDEVVIFTSYHQSPLPMALIARLAGVPRVVGTSDDYPGTLLDVRHRRFGTEDDPGHGGPHEVEAMCRLVAAAGYVSPDPADDRLRIVPVPPSPIDGDYVVVHPSASVPSRAIGASRAAAHAAALADAGWRVVVTGGPADRDLGRSVTPRGGVDLTGATTFRELASVLDGSSGAAAGLRR